MIKVSDVVHSYLKYGKTEEDTIKVQALDHVNMDICEGEFIAIIGHNGSGKSTLAKHFNGILFPEEGSVCIDDMYTTDAEQLQRIRHKVSMVFQNPDNQLIGATVEEDIAFGLENMRVPTEEMQTRIDRSLDAVHMTDKKRESPGNLSGGQKQKTAIAGAIAVSPKCLVLDEATAMLDPRSRKEVIQIAEELNRKQGITVILITHFMEEIAGADKIFVMNKGRVIASGTPRQIFSQVEVLESCGLEISPVMRLAVRLKDEGADLKLPVLTTQDLVDQIEAIYKGGNIC